MERRRCLEVIIEPPGRAHGAYDCGNRVGVGALGTGCAGGGGGSTGCVAERADGAARAGEEGVVVGCGGSILVVVLSFGARCAGRVSRGGAVASRGTD